MVFPEITSLHFQLTGQCNLKCSFCGQQNGMFPRNRADTEIPYSKWLQIADEFAESPVKPSVILWGGEPLLYPRFDELAHELFLRGFPLAVISNGTLINHHLHALAHYFKTIYISLDGPARYHDRYRGPGVFQRVADNLTLLKQAGPDAKTVFLCTLGDTSASDAPQITAELAELAPDKIILQQLMYFSASRIEQYRNWLRHTFQTDDPLICVWRRDDDRVYLEALSCALTEVRRNIALGLYSVPVEIISHCDDTHTHCLAAFRRCHIQYNGSVLFCTDFYGFTAGSVLDHSLQDIFASSRAQTFRREIELGRNPLCDHCSWRANRSFRLD